MMKKLKKNNREAERGRRRAGEQASRRESEIFPFSGALVFSFVLLSVLLSAGCQPNQTILKDAAPPPTPLATVESAKTTFEQDLREMQTADFDYILVFRRKDGGTFDKDDQKYLRDNTPLETNRWRKSDDGKAFIAGSGFGFLPEQMAALRDRFIIEDYSKPEVKQAANSATNANKAANK